jgi:hypothetical protein
MSHITNPNQGDITMSNTDDIRRNMIETGQTRDDLLANIGPTWDTAAMQKEFEPLGFAAPFIVVRRRSDGAKGSLEFTHNPRVYFNWVPD